MDADLFMECQDEELDPCQMVDDDVDEDDWDFQDEDNHSGEEQMDSCEKPWSKEEEPPDPPKPAVTTASTLSTPQVPARTITTNTSTTSITTTGTLNNATPNVAALTPSPAALLSPSMLSPSMLSPSISNQGQQVFMTPAGTFWLPPGPGGAGPQQILLTTQGFPGGAGRPFQMTRLVLNMAPGSSLQPLTFIQSPPLAPLGQPRVPPPVGTVRPTYLTLPISQSAASTTKLSSAPIISQQRIVTATATPPTPALSAVAPPSAPKVVMTVEEFYYGRAEGNQKEPILHNEHVSSVRCFQCQVCRSRLMNNIGLMQHMLCHCEVIMVPKATAGGREEDVTTCRECYRLFSSPQQLKNHQNLVHTPTTYPSICKICDWAFDDETIFLNHMKTNHKPGEMPYTCQVCSFRSSFYSDVVNHFKACHSGYFHLMCVFCLKVFKTSQSYQGHFLRHKKGQGFHCNKCRLQFVLLKDKMDHKHLDHKSFQRPEQLKGLPAGAKVTIRLSHPTPITMPVTPRSPITHPAAVARPAPPPYPVTVARPAPLLVRPINIKTEEQRQPITANPRRRRTIGRKQAVSTLRCMECGTDASDLFAHFPTYVRCLLCAFSTCCSQAYASHMIHKHVPHTAFSTPLHRRSPPCPYQLRCSSCDFVPQTGDQMAKHLVFNPYHSSICKTTTFVEPDMNFYAAAKQAQRRPGGPQKVENTPDAAWLQARNWTEPTAVRIGGGFVAAEFTHGCGPHHGLPKNADAVDYFTLLFPDSLVELVAAETNAHAKTCQYLGGSALGGSGTSDWAPVTADDIRGFLGLVILMGTKNLPDLSQYWSWTHNDNGYTFYRAMSFNRFKQIAANIRMGSETTDKYRGRTEEGDPLCIFRPMLELLGSAMWTIYRPRCCLTIDRALLPQPIKGPPGTSDPRSQPEIWLLCDSKSGYCHRVSIQGGVVGEKAGLETGFRVVPKLVEGLENKHHQLYLAKSLASAPLMAKLLDEAIYASSSFPPPSPILPAPLWDNGRLDKAGDFLQRAFGPLLATRWRDAKEMGCLSTNATPGGTDTVWRRSQTKAGELDPIERPMAFRLLQENMRGVDICKQLLACNPLGGVPEDKYWRRLFWFLVNLSVVNAFILLRESRKDNPPSWVQGGLFSQLVFRKRLGNQMAKCAQKAFEPPLASSQEALLQPPVASRVARGVARTSEEEPLKQRHRIVKVSFSSRRCKNCMKKNIRRESVYGCGVCQINLCKQGHCFWEFHGLSPLTQGSTKIGFVKDKISGQVEFSTEQMDFFGGGKVEMDDNTPIDEIDEAMAPIEEIDSSGDEEETMEEEADDIPGFLPAMDDDMTEEFRADVEGGEYDEPPSSPPPPLREDALSARQLRICLLALCGGLNQASTDFNTQPQRILAWLKERRKQLKQESGQEQQEKQQASLSEGEVDMLEWVLAMWEQQAPITESSLFQKATVLRKKGSFGSSFRISYDWALGFMLQHGLGLRRPGRRPTLSRVLPPSLEERTRRFRDFTQKQILASRLPPGAVAAMDELCVFVDFNLLHESCTAAQRVEALKLWGSGCPLLTVYLTALSDGTVLPGLVLLRSHRSWPAAESLLIEARPVAFTVEDGMDLWSGGVWRRHLSGLGLGHRPRKNLLVVDGHREHLSQMFLCALAASATLPAVVPAGCNHRLHPLDVCLRPVLQRYLLHRWARAMAEPLQDVASAEHLEFSVSHLLVDCLGEALGRLASHTHLMKRSFQLAGILPGGGGGGSQEETQNPEEVQAQLLHSLWEVLVEGEAVEEGEESTDELEEMEDEEEEEEQEDAKEGEEELREERKEPEEERREEEAKTRTGEEPTAEEVKRKTDEEEVKTGKDGDETEPIKTGVDGEGTTKIKTGVHGEGTTERRCLTEEHGETVPTCP